MNGSFTPAGGGATLPSVTNLFAGDGVGGASDSGIGTTTTGTGSLARSADPAFTGEVGITGFLTVHGNGKGLTFPNVGFIDFSYGVGTPITWAGDVGILRDSAGVLRVSDASTGLGALLTGALTIGGGAAITNVLYGTANIGSPTINGGAYMAFDITITDTVVGNVASVSIPDISNTTAVVVAGIQVLADIVRITLFNTDSSSASPTGTISAAVFQF